MQKKSLCVADPSQTTDLLDHHTISTTSRARCVEYGYSIVRITIKLIRTSPMRYVVRSPWMMMCKCITDVPGFLVIAIWRQNERKDKNQDVSIVVHVFARVDHNTVHFETCRHVDILSDTFPPVALASSADDEYILTAKERKRISTFEI